MMDWISSFFIFVQFAFDIIIVDLINHTIEYHSMFAHSYYLKENLKLYQLI